LSLNSQAISIWNELTATTKSASSSDHVRELVFETLAEQGFTLTTTDVLRSLDTDKDFSRPDSRTSYATTSVLDLAKA